MGLFSAVLLLVLSQDTIDLVEKVHSPSIEMEKGEPWIHRYSSGLPNKQAIYRSELELLPGGVFGFKLYGCVPQDFHTLGTWRMTDTSIILKPYTPRKGFATDFVRRIFGNDEYLVPREEAWEFTKAAGSNPQTVLSRYRGRYFKREHAKTFLRGNHYFGLDDRLYLLRKNRNVKKVYSLTAFLSEKRINLPRGANEPTTTLAFKKDDVLEVRTKNDSGKSFWVQEITFDSKKR